MHTLLDLRGNIPSFVFINDGKLHDVKILDQLTPEPGAFYVMDRAYIDFERLARFHEAGSFFVTRAKANLKIQRRYSHTVDRTTGLICDQAVVLTGLLLAQGLRSSATQNQVQRSPERLVFLTNNFTLSALTITQLYRMLLASRTFLQVDKTAPPNQGLLRYHRERSQNANLDRNLGLRPRSHRQETTPTFCQPLRNSTNLELDHVRTNAGGSAAFTRPVSNNRPPNA